MLDLLPFSPTWVLVGLCVVLFYMYLFGPFSVFQKMGVPGPKPLPLFGNFLSYAKGTHIFDQECYQKYNKVYGIFEGHRPILIVGDLELVKEITVKRINTFTNRAQADFAGRGELVSQSILSLKDADWKRVRRAITPTFSSGKLKQMMVHIERCADNFVSHLGRNQKEEAMFDMKEMSGAYTMDVISSTAFGVDVDSINDPDHPLVTNAKPLFNISLFNPFIFIVFVFPHLAGVLERLFGVTFFPKKSMDYFSQTVDRIISMRGGNSDKAGPVDFVHLMLAAHNEELDKKSSDDMVKTGVSTNELKGNAVVLWLAGYESTANTLALVAYNLALNQEAQDQVIEEVHAILEKRGKLDYESVHELPYLDMCINETIRMFPFAQRLDRVCTEDTEVKGLHIPAGTGVNVPVYAIHHDPDIWPEPEKFKPERFTKEAKEARDPYAFLPFGSGPRNCVAMRLALLELKFALAKALANFRFVTCDKTEIPVRMRNTMSNQIDCAVWLKVEARVGTSDVDI